MLTISFQIQTRVEPQKWFFYFNIFFLLFVETIHISHEHYIPSTCKSSRHFWLTRAIPQTCFSVRCTVLTELTLSVDNLKEHLKIFFQFFFQKMLSRYLEQSFEWSNVLLKGQLWTPSWMLECCWKRNSASYIEIVISVICQPISSELARR